MKIQVIIGGTTYLDVHNVKEPKIRKSGGTAMHHSGIC